MTCKTCKGTGKITLLTSEVPCTDCGLDAPCRIDPMAFEQQYLGTFVPLDNAFEREMLNQPTRREQLSAIMKMPWNDVKHLLASGDDTFYTVTGVRAMTRGQMWKVEMGKIDMVAPSLDDMKHFIHTHIWLEKYS